ncbi:SERPINE1 mRNA-binding protein 1-like, partial [Centruroides vittatus]|uniref:SERPINE1 mRNA-binding protein 1-like n=1 Tax=Centruroides vittatus TaxID=120091 RepID=UPI0035100DF0
METTYGVGIKNRYELFYDDEEDPLEILRQQQKETEKKKVEKVPKNAKTKGTKPVTTTKVTKDIPTKGKVNSEPALHKTKSTKPGTDRTVRFSNNSQEDSKETEERRNRRNRDDKLFSDIRESRDGENRRGGRGGFSSAGGGGNMRGSRGRGRGRGGNFGFDSRGKREFDRQSGSDKSGVKPVEKREGAGAHNWGTIKDDLEVQLTPLSDENPEIGERSGDEIVPEQNDIKETELGIEGVKITNEGNNEMTLDEWKKQQEGKRSKASFNLRKAGEGEDSNQWKKFTVLTSKKFEEYDDEEEEEESEDDDEFVKRGRQKQVVDIKINFADSRRARGRGKARGSGYVRYLSAARVTL